MLEYGTTAGLAYKHDFYKEIEMNRARKQTQIQMEQINLAKSKYFSDMFRMGEANNPYDQRKLKELAEKTIAEGGRYQSENPDWLSNPMKAAHLSLMGQTLMNNDYTINAKIYDEQFKAMQSELTANPQLAQQESFIKQWKEAENYKNFGSVTGVETDRKPFVYTSVMPWGDLNTAAAAIGKNFQGKLTKTYAPGTPGKFPGAYEEVIDPVALQTSAYEFYNQNKEQFDKTYDTNKYASPIEYAADLIKNNTKLDSKVGNYQADPDYLAAKAGAKAGAGGAGSANSLDVPWMEVITRKSGNTSPELFQRMFGVTADPLVQTVNGEGRQDFGVRNITFTGDYKDFGNNRVGLQTQFQVTREEAKQMGIVGDGFFSFTDEFGEDDIAPEYKDGRKGIAWSSKGPKEDDPIMINIKGWKVVDKTDPGLMQLSLDGSNIRDTYQPTPGQINNYLNPGMRPVALPDGTQGFIAPDGFIYDALGNQAQYTDEQGRIAKYNFETGTYEAVAPQ